MGKFVPSLVLVKLDKGVGGVLIFLPSRWGLFSNFERARSINTCAALIHIRYRVRNRDIQNYSAIMSAEFVSDWRLKLLSTDWQCNEDMSWMDTHNLMVWYSLYLTTSATFFDTCNTRLSATLDLVYLTSSTFGALFLCEHQCMYKVYDASSLPDPFNDKLRSKLAPTLQANNNRLRFRLFRIPRDGRITVSIATD